MHRLTYLEELSEMSKYRIVTRVKPVKKLLCRWEIGKQYTVQERYLWFFWNDILVTSSELGAFNYLEALIECEKANKAKVK